MKKAVLEGWLYHVSAIDCQCYTLLENPPKLDDLIARLKEVFGENLDRDWVEDCKALFEEHTLDCMALPKCVDNLYKILRNFLGKKVRITIEVIEEG
ncbi:MAG: hypothetical protein DRN15_10840 [Thermoprotei archaeon]|nr:MAG: hypothetical protein DRN15_10840 [Thermoprotei archaeon]